MSVLNNSLLLGQEGGAGYVVERSLRFSSIDSAFCERTFSSAGNRTTWSFSCWVKRSRLTTSSRQVLFGGYGAGNDTDWIEFGFGESSDGYDTFYWTTSNITSSSSAVFRDVSAWYHVLVSYNGSTLVVYVNNSTVLTSSLSGNRGINGAWTHTIGKSPASSIRYFDGYLADIHFIDGQALTPSSFTEVSATTGRLEPKKYAGTFGTNGFWLPFSDTSSTTSGSNAGIGKDFSGNGNYWNSNNLSVTAGSGLDLLVDTPTNYGTDTGVGAEVRGNYCTLNPLQSSATLSNGNLDCSTTSTSWQANVGTVFQSSGKWYAEFTVSSIGAGGIHIGIVGPNYSVAANNYIGNTATSYAYRADGTKFNNATQTSYGASYTTNDVIGVAMDLDAGTLVFYKNGVSQGTAYSGMTGEKAFAVSVGSTTGTHSVVFNAGSRPFAYTAPSGFKALCTANLPAPVVAKPSTVMDVKLYTGNGTSQTISGLGFSPDLVWIKSRVGTVNHVLTDSVRGAALKLASNTTGAEAGTDNGYLSAFTSDGFTVAQGGGLYPGIETNYNPGTPYAYAAWCWDAGSSTVTNTQGSITSSVRANASAGFSIVTYTGTGANATVGHGLGIAPTFVIYKNRDVASNWIVYHQSLGNNSFGMMLNSTAAYFNDSTPFNNTAPTSTVLHVGTNYQTNENTRKIVAYAFAPVAGYSSFGSYVGNGDSSGPFIWTGFRPRWVMWKPVTQSATDWVIRDAARDSYNVVSNYLLANTAGAEGAIAEIDFLSNGFKFRNNLSGNNTNGVQVIYACFAESPFQYARAR